MGGPGFAKGLGKVSGEGISIFGACLIFARKKALFLWGGGGGIFFFGGWGAIWGGGKRGLQTPQTVLNPNFSFY